MSSHRVLPGAIPLIICAFGLCFSPARAENKCAVVRRIYLGKGVHCYSIALDNGPRNLVALVGPRPGHTLQDREVRIYDISHWRQISALSVDAFGADHVEGLLMIQGRFILLHSNNSGGGIIIDRAKNKRHAEYRSIQFPILLEAKSRSLLVLTDYFKRKNSTVVSLVQIKSGKMVERIVVPGELLCASLDESCKTVFGIRPDPEGVAGIAYNRKDQKLVTLCKVKGAVVIDWSASPSRGAFAILLSRGSIDSNAIAFSGTASFHLWMFTRGGIAEWGPDVVLENVTGIGPAHFDKMCVTYDFLNSRLMLFDVLKRRIARVDKIHIPTGSPLIVDSNNNLLFVVQREVEGDAVIVMRLPSL